MKYEAIIFDLDGTLIDSMGIWSEVDKEFLTKRKIAVPPDLFEDLDGGNSFQEVAVYFKKRFQLQETPIEIMQEWTDMVSFHYGNDVELKPGVRHFLENLANRKVKMGVGTSNSHFLAETALKRNEILDFFDTIIVGKDDVRGKPFPDIFLKVAQKLAVNPQRCLVIEDVLAGVQAAKNAGMDVIAIYDQHSKNEAPAIKNLADFWAKDFFEIADYLKIDKVL